MDTTEPDTTEPILARPSITLPGLRVGYVYLVDPSSRYVADALRAGHLVEVEAEEQPRYHLTR